MMDIYFNILKLLLTALVSSALVFIITILFYLPIRAVVVTVQKTHDEQYPLLFVFLILFFAPIGYKFFTGTYELLSQGSDETVISETIQPIKIIKATPPSNVYVDIKFLNDNSEIHNLYVSKTCPNISLSNYNLRVIEYTLNSKPGKVFYRFPQLVSELCN